MTQPKQPYGYSRTVRRDPRPTREIAGTGVASCLYQENQEPYVPDSQDAHIAAYIGYPAVQAYLVEGDYA